VPFRLSCPKTESFRLRAPREPAVDNLRSLVLIRPAGRGRFLAPHPPSAESMRGGRSASNRPQRRSAVQVCERFRSCDKVPIGRTTDRVSCRNRGRLDLQLGPVAGRGEDTRTQTHVESTCFGHGHMKRLVVVAEDSLIVEAISIALRKSGEFNVVAHLDGRSASAKVIIDASPEVVLIDEMESRAQSIELIRQIKAESETATVIVLTLSPESTQLDEMFSAGASAAVSKATNPAALATLIRETLEGRVLHLHRSAGQLPGAAPTSEGAEESVLSVRELEVLRLVAAGSTNNEIARKLWVTEQTVKFHLSNIYRKLDVANRTEASRYAHVNGLVGGGQ